MNLKLPKLTRSQNFIAERSYLKQALDWSARSHNHTTAGQSHRQTLDRLNFNTVEGSTQSREKQLSGGRDDMQALWRHVDCEMVCFVLAASPECFSLLLLLFGLREERTEMESSSATLQQSSRLQSKLKSSSEPWLEFT